jgi:hypothetical protein
MNAIVVIDSQPDFSLPKSGVINVSDFAEACRSLLKLIKKMGLTPYISLRRRMNIFLFHFRNKLYHFEHN